MRARLPWILFFISLALNLSIVAGVLYVGHHKLFGEPQGEALVEALAEDLKFTAAQNQALLALRQEVAERRLELEQSTGRLNDLVVQALEQEVYDPETMRWAMIERSQPFREFMIGYLGELHDFVRQLDQQQRNAFLGRIAADRDFLRNLFPRPER